MTSPLEASNLGQVIGRALYGDEIGTPSKKPPALVARGRGWRRDQILELVRKMGSVRCADLMRELGITNGNATVTLYNLHEEGVLVRSGEPGQYRYSLP